MPARFVTFTRATTGKLFAVNPAFILGIWPHEQNTDHTVLVYHEGQQVEVTAPFDEALQALNG